MARKRKIPSVPTAERLEESALFYLERYAASRASLRRVLQNRVRRATFFHPAFAADKPAQEALFLAIDKLVTRFTESGLLNDKAFAEMKAGSLRRSGRSARVIARKLQEKGIAAEEIEAALGAADEEVGDRESAEREAFAKWARRKSLTPEKLADPIQRRKIIAAAARQGFSFATMEAVLKERFDEAAEDSF